MRGFAWVRLLLAVAIAVSVGCSSDKSTSPGSNAVRGRITARATGITSQNGNTYSVVVYAYDWSPGATGPSVASIRQMITGDNFASTAVLDSVDSQGTPTLVEKVFDPGTYSVVFFVSPPGSPPQHFAELRVAVDGDKTVDAPAWAQWIHP
jgi:hypothetical protein